MRAWTSADVPAVGVPGPVVQVHDSSRNELVEAVPADDTARMYVCGITPYDATHIGHAATYVAFDLLNRAWRCAGHQVRYVQNVTDVDDPLLERAAAIGEGWEHLAERETQLFREDMSALRVLAPDAYVGAVESISLVVGMVERLQGSGAVYAVDEDLYFSVTSDPDFGTVSHWSRAQMLAMFADRGGDPDRLGKKDPLDCLVWQAERPGEPAWDSPFGRGRPGWHIECAAIACEYLGAPLDVQGGGIDLLFPHHEMSASEAQVADPEHRFASSYVHAGMVGLDGEKMSKSRGNLVLVSTLREAGRDPMAIRLALLGHHYRTDWSWTETELGDAEQKLERWGRAVHQPRGAATGELVSGVLAALADDLDAPTSVRLIQRWVEDTEAGDQNEPAAGEVVRRLADACLGLEL